MSSIRKTKQSAPPNDGSETLFLIPRAFISELDEIKMCGERDVTLVH
jgi:hypothetical protein